MRHIFKPAGLLITLAVFGCDYLFICLRRAEAISVGTFGVSALWVAVLALVGGWGRYKKRPGALRPRVGVVCETGSTLWLTPEKTPAISFESSSDDSPISREHL